MKFRITQRMRRWVRFCRWFFWTLAARRQDWRATIKWIEHYHEATKKPEIARVVDLDEGGRVVRNKYTYHPHPRTSLDDCLLLMEYDRGIYRMPKV